MFIGFRKMSKRMFFYLKKTVFFLFIYLFTDFVITSMRYAGSKVKSVFFVFVV